jgi:hypothetical protein
MGESKCILSEILADRVLLQTLKGLAERLFFARPPVNESERTFF